jgi:hypothetical protein
MSSLLDSLSEVSPEIVRSLAARLSEPNDFIHKGLQTSAAVMLGAIASRAKEPAFMSQVTNMIIAFGRSHPADTEAGSAFLSTVFGSDRPLVEKKIALATGLGNSSASAVLANAAPLLLGILAPKIASSTLEHEVTEELPRFANLVPAGIPGQSRLPSLAASAAIARGRHLRAHSETKAGKHWLWPVLVLGALLIAALVWYAYRGATVPPNFIYLGM